MNPIFRVIDSETCGFEGGIVELASVDVNQGSMLGFQDSNPMQDYVKPDRPIEFGAMAIHHITEDMVSNADPIELVWPVYTGKVPAHDESPEPDYFVAHNASFDKGVLPPSNVPWICTLKLSRYVYPQLESHTNQYLRYALDLDPIIKCILPEGLHAHRALYDVYCTAVLFAHLASKLQWDVGTMLRATSEPSLIHYVKFGKYAKQRPTFEEAVRNDPSYFQWCLGNMSDLDEDRRHTMVHWLQHYGQPLTQQRGRFR